MIQTKLADLSAFCSTRPPDSEVTAFLEDLGFFLDFDMPAKKYGHCAALAAQYHYKDRDGTEVIFLAGRDIPDGLIKKYPQHASRWWIYPGNSQYRYTLAVQELAKKWQLQWI